MVENYCLYHCLIVFSLTPAASMNSAANVVSLVIVILAISSFSIPLCESTGGASDGAGSPFEFPHLFGKSGGVGSGLSKDWSSTDPGCTRCCGCLFLVPDLGESDEDRNDGI